MRAVVQGPGLAAVDDLVYGHLQSFQVMGHAFQIHAAFFGEIPPRVFLLAFGLGMLDQI